MFPLMFANSAVVALMLGDAQEAMEFATQAVAINPEFWVGYLHLGTARLMTGDYEGAIQALGAAEKYSSYNSSRATSLRARALIKLGRNDEARNILAGLIETAEDKYVPPYQIAAVHAALGELDSAIEWLRRALDQGGIRCRLLENNAELAIMHSDPRFESLLHRCTPPGGPAVSQLPE